MKQIYNIIFLALIIMVSACESDLMQTIIGEGEEPMISASSSDVILIREDSANVALTVTWTDPQYLDDTSNGNVIGTYTVEVSKNQSFIDSKSYSFVNEFEKSFTVYSLNKVMLDMEYEPDVVAPAYIRVKSIFFTEDTLTSNVLNINVTPYTTVIPPTIAVPDELWISGEALTTGWNSPFLPEQQFSKETETTFSITIDLIGGETYEMITDGTGSNWTPVYRIDPELDPASMVWGGTFVWDGDGSDYGWGSKLFMSPPNDGTFKIIMDFQDATFTVIDVTGPPAIAVPEALYIIGSATAAQWGDVSSQQFTKISSTKFEISIDLFASSEYALITDPTGANWTPVYRLEPIKKPEENIWGGSFVWDGDGSDYGWGTKNFLSPEDEGKYKLIFDFQTATYTVSKE